MGNSYQSDGTGAGDVYDVYIAPDQATAPMDKTETPFVSVIIPVYNDQDRLTTCLEALRAQTYPASRFEIIVVDNGSKEPVDQVVADFPQARCLHEPKSGSYAARNRGVEASRGEVLAFTDADCLPTKTWIENGVEALLKAPDVGLVAGKVDLFAQDPARPNIYELYDRFFYLDQKVAVERGHYGATANLFTYRSVMDKVGLFNSEFKSSGDSDWGKRVFRHGYAQHYAEDACVRHPARDSFEQLHRKTVRITGGLRDRDRQRPDRPSTAKMFLLHARLWKPPLRKVVGVLAGKTSRSLPSFGTRIKVAMLLLYLHYVRRVEFLRLALGGNSKNY